MSTSYYLIDTKVKIKSVILRGGYPDPIVRKGSKTVSFEDQRFSSNNFSDIKQIFKICIELTTDI